MTLRLGTRASALAVAQSTTIADLLGADVVTITSEGDVNRASLLEIGGQGIFANALRDALVAGDVDVLVHSYKDLPTVPTPGMVVAAVPARADMRDVLCARDGLTLATLPAGAKVGTGSPRRRAQLAASRPDIELVDIRGNVDTRLGRLHDPDPARRLDAVVLAAAGLTRVGYVDRITEYFSLDAWQVAPAQGALAIEVRTGDEALVAHLDHPATRFAADAERHVLARLDAGCAAPVATWAHVDDTVLTLTATVYALDGTASVTASAAEPIASDAWRRAADTVADALLDGGAADLAPLTAR